MKYSPFNGKGIENLYSLKDFKSLKLDKKTLDSLGLKGVDESVIGLFNKGVAEFENLLSKGRLTASTEFSLSSDSPPSLQVHNYTGMCPKNVFEISPSDGACSISCLYCLVSDGDHRKPITLHREYPQLLARELKKIKGKNFFYFSPKVEAFSEPLLQTGISHEILRTFISHYEENLESGAKIFIATKAGPRHLNYANQGETIIELLERMKGRVQYNGSIGIMPEYIQEVLEPNSPSLEERLEGIKICQEKGIYARAVLAQPIIPIYLNEERVHGFMKKMREFGVDNVKPEFLTASFENLAVIGQFINHFDPNLLAPFLNLYISSNNRNHVKQRSRTAPSRTWSTENLALINAIASSYGISTSICNWVCLQTGTKDLTKCAGERGFRCLGYQEGILSGNQ